MMRDKALIAGKFSSHFNGHKSTTVRTKHFFRTVQESDCDPLTVQQQLQTRSNTTVDAHHAKFPRGEGLTLA
jgi:hypothetical protein